MANDLLTVGTKVLDDYEKWLTQQTQVLVEECAKRASAEAGDRFASAYYSGVNDVSTGAVYTDSDEIEMEVFAEGNAALFIEFGTGVNNATTSAEGKERSEVEPNMLEHGEYGLGLAKNPKGWSYYGETGNSPNARIVDEKESGVTVIRTTGDSAASPLYMSRESVLKESRKIIKEVFRK